MQPISGQLERLHVATRGGARPPRALRDDLDFGQLASRHLVDHYHRAPDPCFSVDFARNDFRLIASGRVLECVDDDFEGSLRLRDPDDGREIRMPLCLARIGGVLRPIR